jgi:hypothetical protein
MCQYLMHCLIPGVSQILSQVQPIQTLAHRQCQTFALQPLPRRQALHQCRDRHDHQSAAQPGQSMQCAQAFGNDVFVGGEDIEGQGLPIRQAQDWQVASGSEETPLTDPLVGGLSALGHDEKRVPEVGGGSRQRQDGGGETEASQVSKPEEGRRPGFRGSRVAAAMSRSLSGRGVHALYGAWRSRADCPASVSVKQRGDEGGRRCHHGVGQRLSVAPQLFIPSRLYAGHQRIKPVARGMMPSRPQNVCGPTKTIARRMTPMAIRSPRSTMPTLRVGLRFIEKLQESIETIR